MVPPDSRPTVDMLLGQVAFLERRAGRPVVRVSVGIPAGYDPRILRETLERELRANRRPGPDLVFVVRGSKVRLLTVDFDLAEAQL